MSEALLAEAAFLPKAPRVGGEDVERVGHGPTMLRYRDRRVAERDLLKIFCAMHALAKEQRRRLRNAAGDRIAQTGRNVELSNFTEALYDARECTKLDSGDIYRHKGTNPGPEGKYERDAVQLHHCAGKSASAEKTTVLTAYNGSNEAVDTVTCGKLATVGEITGETEATETIVLGKCKRTYPEEVNEKGKPVKSPCARPPGRKPGRSRLAPCRSR